MKTVTIEGREYKIRTLPLEYAPEVFEVIRKMFAVADQVVKESSEPVPKDRDETLKVFMAIVDYTQEKLREAEFFREHPEPLDISSSGTGIHSRQETVKAPEAKKNRHRAAEH